MKHLTLDVFGKGTVASLEAKADKDTVADEPTVSIFVPGVDDEEINKYLGNSIWTGYNVAIQKIADTSGGIVVGLEGSQQMLEHAKKTAVEDAIIQLDESRLEGVTHSHDYSLFMVDRTMEQDMNEVIRKGRVSGVYLIEARDAYSKEFIDMLDKALGTHVYYNIGDAERGVERYLATGK